MKYWQVTVFPVSSSQLAYQTRRSAVTLCHSFRMRIIFISFPVQAEFSVRNR